MKKAVKVGRPKGSRNRKATKKYTRKTVKFMATCQEFEESVLTLCRNGRIVTQVRVIGRTIEGLPYLELVTEPIIVSEPQATTNGETKQEEVTH